MPDFMMAMTINPQAKRPRTTLSTDISESFEVFKVHNIKVNHLYATMGRYDFVAVFQAQDQTQAFRVASEINNKGILETETWPIIPYEEFTRLLA